MNRLMLGSNFVLSSLFFGVVIPPAMARITPEPTMCFIRMANGTFRDLTSVCGANRYMTIARPNIPAPETLRQNSVQNAAPNAVQNGAPNNVQNAAPTGNNPNVTNSVNSTRTIQVIENPPAFGGGVPGQPIVPR
jgi:hypothetical protein